MTTNLIDRFRRWFEYENDAHTKVLSSFESVPSDRRSSPEFRRAVSLLAHIVEARRVWLGRMGVIPHSTGTLFPDESDVNHVTSEWRRMRQEWLCVLSSTKEKDLARVFEYQSYDSGRFHNSVEEILTQLFGHSWYHRGQIAMLVRAAGGQPAATDFVYWCRQPISNAAK
jgi:uncharacterized damage-inducible protein DinB